MDKFAVRYNAMYTVRAADADALSLGTLRSEDSVGGENVALWVNSLLSILI